jgi:cytochrome b561
MVPMLFLGEELMEVEDGGGTLFPSMHVSIGVSILVLSLIRLAWRMGHAAPPLPATTASWEAALSRVTHVLFYVLMIGLPLTGWLALPHFLQEEPGLAGLTAFGFTLPTAPATGLPAGELHEIGGKIGIALLILHVAAVIKHHLMDGDGFMKRMLPGGH